LHSTNANIDQLRHILTSMFLLFAHCAWSLSSINKLCC